MIPSRSLQAEYEIRKYIEVVKSINFGVVKLSVKFGLCDCLVINLGQNINLSFLFY